MVVVVGLLLVILPPLLTITTTTTTHSNPPPLPSPLLSRYDLPAKSNPSDWFLTILSFDPDNHTPEEDITRFSEMVKAYDAIITTTPLKPNAR